MKQCSLKLKTRQDAIAMTYVRILTWAIGACVCIRICTKQKYEKGEANQKQQLCDYTCD